jgi:hypothetical protein
VALAVEVEAKLLPGVIMLLVGGADMFVMVRKRAVVGSITYVSRKSARRATTPLM